MKNLTESRIVHQLAVCYSDTHFMYNALEDKCQFLQNFISVEHLEWQNEYHAQVTQGMNPKIENKKKSFPTY